MKFCLKNKGRDHFGDRSIDETVILKHILYMWDVVFDLDSFGMGLGTVMGYFGHGIDSLVL
jgi:hypothetical protein